MDLKKERAKAKAGRTVKRYKLPDGTWISVNQERFLAPAELFGDGTAWGNRWGAPERLASVFGAGGGIATCAAAAVEAAALRSPSPERRRAELLQSVVLCGGGTDIAKFDDCFVTALARRLGGARISLGTRYTGGDEAGQRDGARPAGDDGGSGQSSPSDRYGEDGGIEAAVLERHISICTEPRHKLQTRCYATWAGAGIMGDLPTYREWFITKEQFEEMGPEAAVERRTW